MMTGRLELDDSNSLSSTSSSSILALRQREEDANQRCDMKFSDIIDIDTRQKVEAFVSLYPSYPLLCLVYELVKTNQTVEEVRDSLENTHQNRAQYLPVSSLKNVEDVEDDVMRGKIEEIRTIAPSVTVWWAFYALQVCHGDTESATRLIFEKVVDASEDPVARMAPVSTAHIYSPVSPSDRRSIPEEVLLGSPPDSESSVFGCQTLSQTSGNKSFLASFSSVEHTPNSSFVNISDDDEESIAEESATLSPSPDFGHWRKGIITKGKCVATSAPAEYSSDTDMNGCSSFKERYPETKDEKKNNNCKFCDKDLENWSAKINHEFLCHRMKARQVCIKCRKEFSMSNIKRHERTCDVRSIERRDGSELKERALSVLSSATSRSSSRSLGIKSDSPTEEELQKVRRMQEVFPHLTVDDCIVSLRISGGNVEEALDTEKEISASDDEDIDQGSCSQQDNPLKRMWGDSSVERAIKKSRTQNRDKQANIKPANRWIKTTFFDLCQDSTKLTLVHISLTESRLIPTKLLCDNSKYLKDLIELEGNLDAAVKEIELQDIEPALFDAIIQYMVCRNVSFGTHLSEIQTVTSMVNFIALAERLKVAGPATTLLEPLQAILKQDRQGPYPKILKVGHVHKIFSNIEDKHHPIKKLFVKASVRAFMKERNENPAGDDSDEEYEVDANDFAFRNKPAHFAWKLNKEFEGALMAKLFETMGNRVTRPTYPNTKNSKSFTVYFTDPFDDSQFTL